MTVQEIKSMDEFDALLESGKVFFVDFYTDWCGPCKTVSPMFEKLAGENAQEGVVEFYKVNIDDVPGIAAALQIRSIPTFYVYKGNELLDRVVGANRGALAAFVQKGLEA